MPTEIDQLERRATQLEIEKQALKKEDDRNSRERLAQVEKELAGIREQSAGLKARWKKEKEEIARVRQLKERIEQLKLEEQSEERKGNLQRVAEIRYGLLRQAEQELAKVDAQADGRSASRMLKEEVDEEDIARIVSKWTGIPVSKMLEGEVKKLVTMEERLRQRVVGRILPLSAWPTRFAVRAPDSAIPSARLAPSSSWGRQVSAKPNLPVLSPNSCLTTSILSCESTCPSTWRGTLSHA